MRTLRAVVGTALLGLLAPLLVCVPAATTAAAGSSSSWYEAQVVRLTNVQRARHHLPALRTASTCTDGYAERWARYLAAHHVFRHQNLWPILTHCRKHEAGENIATGYTSPAALVSAWMRSPGHRHNILDRRLRFIGVGAVRDRAGTWWVVQDFSG